MYGMVCAWMKEEVEINEPTEAQAQVTHEQKKNQQRQQKQIGG